MTGPRDLQRELEALRRELRQVPRVAEDSDATAGTSAGSSAGASAAPPPGDMRAEIERVLNELQDRLTEVTDEAEDIVAAHPYASVAAAFLLGVLVANFMSRAR